MRPCMSLGPVELVVGGMLVCAGLTGENYEVMQCRYLECVGLTLSGRYARARDAIGALTMAYPAWERAAALRDVFKRKVEAQGAVGVAWMAAAGALVVGVAVWWWSASSSTSSSSRPSSPAFSRREESPAASVRALRSRMHRQN